MFQTIQMQFQYRGNTHFRSSCWKRTSLNGNHQSQGSQGMENSYQDKGSGKLSRVHQLLQMVYKELQSYGKTF